MDAAVTSTGRSEWYSCIVGTVVLGLMLDSETTPFLAYNSAGHVLGPPLWGGCCSFRENSTTPGQTQRVSVAAGRCCYLLAQPEYCCRANILVYTFHVRALVSSQCFFWIDCTLIEFNIATVWEINVVFLVDT